MDALFLRFNNGNGTVESSQFIYSHGNRVNFVVWSVSKNLICTGDDVKSLFLLRSPSSAVLFSTNILLLMHCSYLFFFTSTLSCDCNITTFGRSVHFPYFKMPSLWPTLKATMFKCWNDRQTEMFYCVIIAHIRPSQPYLTLSTCDREILLMELVAVVSFYCTHLCTLFAMNVLMLSAIECVRLCTHID